MDSGLDVERFRWEAPTPAAWFPVPRLGSGFWDSDPATMPRWLDLVSPVVAVSECDDLLGVLGVARCERRHCRAWRWLFDPSGGHGLGDRLLRRFVERIGITGDVVDASGRVSVAVEEAAGATRADLVIRVDDMTVVVEAKIDAVEHPGQCAALEAAWPTATLVFLTLDGRRPDTASTRPWRAVAWRELVADLVEAIADTDSCLFGFEPTGRRAAAAYRDAALRHLCRGDESADRAAWGL